MSRHSFLTLLIYFICLILGSVFLFVIGVDALEGRVDFPFYADSTTYHLLSAGLLEGVDENTELVGVAGNFLGPLMVLKVAGDNYYGVLIINATIFLCSVLWISRSFNLSSVALYILLILNPLTVSSFLSVNKEVISLFAVVLLLLAISKRSLFLFFICACVSMMVRWQMFLFTVVIFSYFWFGFFGRFSRSKLLSFMLLSLSVVYVALLPVFAPIQATFELSASEYEGSGLYEWLVNMQAQGLYFLIFPIKAAHLLFGMGLRFDRLVSPDNLYNDFWQLLHSTSLLALFILLWRNKLASLKNDFFFCSVVYVALFALSPIYAPRYFYPVYVLWACAYCKYKYSTHLVRNRLGVLDDL